MPGASEQTRRVRVVNANWNAGNDGDDGRFEVMLVTEDNAEHFISPSAASMSAVLALTQVDAALLWDPENRTLIAANIVGEWLHFDEGAT
jgi:hypothetical protein